MDNESMLRTGVRERAVARAHMGPLHPDIMAYLDTFPTRLRDLPSIIISGPPGSGKRTLALVAIGGFSPSCLRYEKKMSVTIEGRVSHDPPSIPMSDIHFEVDMALPCCGTRAGWGAVHKAITAAVEIRNEKTAIVLCKGFQRADSDLVRAFSGYMDTHADNVDLRYIIVTEHPSALPGAIRSRCRSIPVGRPHACLARKLIGETPTVQLVERKSAIGAMAAAASGATAQLGTLRDAIYAGLTRNMDIGKWTWSLLCEWRTRCDVPPTPDMDDLAFEAVLIFSQEHDRSYRPIFHLERLALSLGAILQCRLTKP